MKTCKTCKETKELSEYHKGNAEGLLRTVCKTCHREQCKKYYAENKAVSNAQTKRYYVENKAAMKAWAKKYRAENKAAIDAQRKRYYVENKAVIKARSKKWSQANPDKRSASAAVYKKANPDKISALNAKRRASKLQAIPAWFDKEEVNHIYKLAKAHNLVVDHMVPLNSNLVCGLHTADNLRCVHSSVNASKGNRHWPQMWEAHHGQ